MCRNFNAFLKPVRLSDLLDQANASADTLRERLAQRQAHLHAVAEDCSKKSTKAGYDAAGMAVGVIPLAGVLAALERGAPAESALPAGPLTVKLARDGGDLLKTWDGLVARLGLKDTDYVTNWATHVRQASQGDMYSEPNAHPQQERLERQAVRIYAWDGAALTSTQRPRTGGPTLFSDTHNGDINDAGRYKRFLEAEGFAFISNSDSCVEPALKRFLYEHLLAGAFAGALRKLAAEDFLRDDAHGPVADKVDELLTLAATLAAEGAEPPTVAAALVARVLEHSHPESKFTFQSFTPHGKASHGYLGGGTYTMTRGGNKRGGEEGGELIFHLPKPYDALNHERFAFLSASEENALKEQVALLDAGALARGEVRRAEPRTQEVTFLKDARATASITEGVLPLFDVYPGELVQVNADGAVTLFDIYSGCALPLIDMDGRDAATGSPAAPGACETGRRERLAPLKVFRVDYAELDGQPIPCPYNKYGEEILVIQPLALRHNTEKLFERDASGRVGLRSGAGGVGLTMGTDDVHERARRVRALTHVITGAAGTSFLINEVAANIARKLNLHRLPVLNVDGFTGSDAIPAYADRGTLFLANSNSGGTSDTIKLTHELAGLPSVIARLRAEAALRDPELPEVQKIQAALERIEALQGSGKDPSEWSAQARELVEQKTPWVYVVTNIEASALGNIGRGLDPAVRSAAGAGITELPEEECVGSTFAAIASLQWQLALHAHIGEIRGDISSRYAQMIYAELAQLPDAVERMVGDEHLHAEIDAMAEELVGGNFDFVFTGYVDGVPEEQAHKAAEMIQEMFAGWHFFQFQHGKYAHMKRRTRHSLGSILGHNAPPPSWPFFNARAKKAPYEIGPRVATSFVVAHASDEQALRDIPDYAPDYVFRYPADSVALYPAQAIVIGQLISYLWGLQKKRIGARVRGWNQPLVDWLCELPREATAVPTGLRAEIESYARRVLGEFLELCRTTPWFDRLEGRRRAAVCDALALLGGAGHETDATYTTGGYLGSEAVAVPLTERREPGRRLSDADYLSVLKDLAVELSDTAQSKRLADHFLTDAQGRTLPRRISVERPRGRTRSVFEYDALIEYEGLGTFYDVEPVHPPKIAKAKKGWL